MADIQAAAIRKDPKRPGWLADEMLPLPVGTETVYGFPEPGVRIAMPSGKLWATYDPHWDCEFPNREIQADHWEVYHVPPIDQPPKITADTPTVKSRIIPPVEIEAHAQALGWTPESRVYRNSNGSIRVYPSRRGIDPDGYLDDTCVLEATAKRDPLLPNRTVPADPLDQLAAEAQAEGEYGRPVVSGTEQVRFENITFKAGPEVLAANQNVKWVPLQAPKPLRPAGEVAREFQLFLMPGVTRDMSLSQWICTSNTDDHIRAWIAAAIEQDRGSR